MPRISVNAEDPRLSRFANLQNRSHDRFFVTEGRMATARLIASDYQVEAVVTDREDEAITEGLCDSVPVYLLSRAEVSRLVGFRFHRGVLGLGHRRSKPMNSLDRLSLASRSLLLGIIGVSDPDNVGSLLRTAACLGVSDILIDTTTIDPLSRRVTRVSMAHNLSARFHSMGDPLEAIEQLQNDGFDVLAATPSNAAADISHYQPDRPVALLLGNEAEGLPLRVQLAASQRVRIAMPPGPDSLNVAVAGAILIHQLQRSQP